MADLQTDGKLCPIVYRVSWQNFFGHVPGVGMAKPPRQIQGFRIKAGRAGLQDARARALPGSDSLHHRGGRYHSWVGGKEGRKDKAAGA